MQKIDTEGEHRLPVSIFFSQSFSAANFSKYGANSSFSYAYPAMNTQSIKSRVISGSSCSARMRFHSSFACWLSSASSRFRSSKRPLSVQFKSFGRKSAVLPQGDGQAAQSGETWISACGSVPQGHWRQKRRGSRPGPRMPGLQKGPEQFQPGFPLPPRRGRVR